MVVTTHRGGQKSRTTSFRSDKKFCTLDTYNSITKNMKTKTRLAIMTICVVILTSCGKKPTSSFSWTPNTPKAGETVSFINKSSDAKKYDWNLGNMKISSEKEPQNTYDQPGQYIIDLTARNGAKSNESTQTITIVP
jgi:PKD repeat protein